MLINYDSWKKRWLSEESSYIFFVFQGLTMNMERIEYKSWEMRDWSLGNLELYILLNHVKIISVLGIFVSKIET